MSEFVANLPFMIGCPMLVILVVIAVRVANNQCPAGGSHNKVYTRHYIDLAFYRCKKCGGEFSHLVSENDIAWLEHNKACQPQEEQG